MKLTNQLFVLFALAAFTFFACQQPAVEEEMEMDMEAIRAEIADLEAAYAKASNAKDAEALVAYYADDAQSMAPDEPVMVGKEAILASTKEEMADDTSGTSLNLAVVDVWAAGDYAVEQGTWTNVDADGNVVSKGKFMTLFEKRDGKYVAIRDIWNSDMDDDEDEEMAEEAAEE